ncbi:MAG TPA: Na+/H+ antiporter subunit C [Halomonas sp.]|nr:Na+/H+ antiporter subunit C [Halomonas sp.]
MESLFAITTGVLSACGLYLTLRGRTFPVVVGLTLLSYAVNLFLFSMGGLTTDGAAVVNANNSGMTDPLPQALVLTAIVIGFAMTAFAIILAMRSRGDMGNDHVDGHDYDVRQDNSRKERQR